MSSPPDPKPDRPAWHQVHLWEITWVRDLFWIVLAAFLLWLGYELRAIFTPVLVALALAYLFHPTVTECEKRWGMPRPLTIGLIVALMLLAGVGLLAWLGPKLAVQAVDLVKAAPDYVGSIAARLDLDLSEIQVELSKWAKGVQEDPAGFFADRAAVLLSGTGKALAVISSLLGTVTFLLISFALIPIYFFFFAWQFGPLVHQFEQYIPASRRTEVLRITGKMDRVVADFFRDRVLIALIMAGLFCIGWSPLLADVPYFLMLGLAAGLLSIIPYASAVAWPTVVGLKYLAVTSGVDAAGFDMWAVVVWPSVVYIVVQAIEGWILTPFIQGKSMEMSVVTILIVVFVGGAVGGMYGLLLCIPVAACLKILLQEMMLPQLKHWSAEH